MMNREYVKSHNNFPGVEMCRQCVNISEYICMCVCAHMYIYIYIYIYVYVYVYVMETKRLSETSCRTVGK